MLLHQFNVAPHRRFIHHLASLRVMFVAIHAAYQQRLAVQAEQAVFDSDAAKADIVRLDLNGFALRVEQRQRGAVERRRFCAPQRGRVNAQAQLGAIGIVAAPVDNRAAR